MKYLGEPLNGFVPNSQGGHVWSLARTSLNVRVKGQGHQGQKNKKTAIRTEVVIENDVVLYVVVVTLRLQ